MLRGKAVLVVEDEYFIAQDLRAALEAAGAIVVGPVADPDAALTLVSGTPVDAAMLDINLLGAINFSVADRLAAQGIPFVFATGYETATVPAGHAGVPLWRKPYDAQEVVAALAAMVS